MSAGSPKERDEFTAQFDQEFLWSEEGSHLGFMKCSYLKGMFMTTVN